LIGDTLQILPRIAILAAVVSAYPVEYEDLSHFGPAPVQYHQPAPLAKHLVVEKYVSLTRERFLLLGATKYITLPNGKLNTTSQEYISSKSHTTPVVYQFIHGYVLMQYIFSLYLRLQKT
jgi:hypothetical protein